MYSPGRIQLSHSQYVYELPLKIPVYIVSMHPLTRVLNQLLEFLVLDLKQSPDVECGGEPVYKVGPTMSSGVRYLNTVILYIKLQ